MWKRCPWCGVEGVPEAIMRECRSWHKADLDCWCEACGHEHWYLGLRCSGTGGQAGLLTEQCACDVFVTPKSPCKVYLEGGSWYVPAQEEQDKKNCTHPAESIRRDTYSAGCYGVKVQETCLACGKIWVKGVLDDKSND